MPRAARHAYLCRPNFNVEVTALIGNFQDFRPSKTIDSQSVLVNEKPISTHTQLDVHAFWVLPSISIWPRLELWKLYRSGSSWVPQTMTRNTNLKSWHLNFSDSTQVNRNGRTHNTSKIQSSSGIRFDLPKKYTT